MHTLFQTNDSKMVLLVLDGLGGLSMEPTGPTELEAAHTPHLDQLASEGTLGQITPIRHGITPGSGPAHLALFGYDPIKTKVGRGIMEASGVGLTVGTTDVAARGNLCTMDSTGLIIDRRAGRISSKNAIPLIEQLGLLSIPDAEFKIRHVKEHRFTIVMSGSGLSAEIVDTDPQHTGMPAPSAVARSKSATRSVHLINQWIDAAQLSLADEKEANMVTLRGFSSDPQLPSFKDMYALHACSIAVYPMYRGLSQLAGMHTISFDGDSPSDQFSVFCTERANYDFFFVHIKETDSCGEDGDFDGKVAAIEAVDRALPELLHGHPDVLVVTGDHSTPARMRSHSWHPVPLLLWAPHTVREDTATAFGESNCATGGLGSLTAMDVLPLMLAHVGRLAKFGA